MSDRAVRHIGRLILVDDHDLARTPGRKLVVEALALTDKEIAAKEGDKQPSANSPAHRH